MSSQPDSELSRRKFLAAGAGLVAVAGVGAVAGVKIASRDASNDSTNHIVEFSGIHQAGIVTPAQDRLHFAAFDVTTKSRTALIGMLRSWSEAANQMVQGKEVGAFGATSGPYLSPPTDTGEALDLDPANLTITIGFGPSLFRDSQGRDRFGISAAQPAALRDLPHFAGDQLDPRSSGGDLCVQACADDPQVAVHAIRNLSRLAFGTAVVRWTQLGFGRTSSTSTKQVTHRNLFGFKDGTSNVMAENTSQVEEFVWVGPDDDPSATWLSGGTFLVARRIRMHIETWDRSSLAEQEAVIGRDKREGAPLSGGGEFTDLDLDVAGKSGPLIPLDAHVRLAHPSTNDGSMLLRRGYNFADGVDELGRLNAGLFFIAFTRDPVRHFVPIQQRLARDDALSEYIEHTGSAIFAVPPGLGESEYIGQPLFEGGGSR